MRLAGDEEGKGEDEAEDTDAAYEALVETVNAHEVCVHRSLSMCPGGRPSVGRSVSEDITDETDMLERGRHGSPPSDVMMSLSELPKLDKELARLHAGHARQEAYFEILMLMEAESLEALEETLFQGFLRWCLTPAQHAHLARFNLPEFASPTCALTLRDVRLWRKPRFERFMQLRAVYVEERAKRRAKADTAAEEDEQLAEER
jgi:hypothetical protein